MRTIRKITLCSAFLLLIAHFGSALLASPATLILNEPTTTLPEAKAGAEYSHQFRAEGGLPPLAWKVKEGDLPPEMKLEATGKLHGTPKSARHDPYKFVIEVSDSSQPPQTFSQAFTLTIQPAQLRIVTGQSAGRPDLRIASAILDPQQINPARLGNARGAGGAAGNGAAASSGGREEAPTPTATPKPIRKVWGRIRPASMDEVFARIQSSATLSSDAVVKEKLRQLGFAPRKMEDGSEAPESQQSNDRNKIETAEERIEAERKETGAQKKAVVYLLNHILDDRELRSEFGSRRLKYPHLSKDTLEKLLLTLNSYVGNVTVRVELDNEPVATAMTDKDGFYEVMLKENDEGKFYVFSTEADSYASKRTVVVADRDLKLDLPIEDRPVSLLARAVVGYQQAGAASTDFEQNYFFDLYISKSLPFLQKINPDFGERWRAWGAIRAVSAPQSGNVTIGDLARGLATNISSLKAKEAARVFDYLGGIEVRLPRFSNSSLLPSFDRDTKQKFSLSFIASGGFVTPTNPAEGVKTFKVSDQFRAEFEKTVGGEELRGKDFVAFAPSDRDRFFRQYYAGIRMQTLFFNRYNVPLQRFPAQLDLQFGVNEYVTAGRVRGGVIRLDGYFPLPYGNLQFINLFGTAIIKPVRSQVKNTLLLEQVEDQKKFDPKTAVLPVSHFNRDYYRVGIGIDFVSFIGKLF